MENRITGHTKLYCLIGSPVGHSGSPAMYNYSFARTGEDGAYLAFDVPLEQVGKAVEAIKTFHVKGFNITMPDKTAVMDYLDEISPAARLIGACNTVVVSEDGRLIGYNTDGQGFTDNLRAHGVEVKGKKLLILGTGGAANAISIQTALEGAAEITIFNRRDEFFASGQRIVEKLAREVPDCRAEMCDLEDQKRLAEAVRDSDILINATKVGMKPMDKDTLIPAELLHPGLIVADTVYNPLETRLLREAKEAGCQVIGGIGMLIWQGAAAFRLFTGKEMPVKEVEERFFAE